MQRFLSNAMNRDEILRACFCHFPLCFHFSFYISAPDPNVVSSKIIVSNKLLGLLRLGLELGLGSGSFYMREIIILITYWNC